MTLLHSDMTFCNGENCEVKESCARYLAGQKFKNERPYNWWLDSNLCDKIYYIKYEET